MKIFITGSSGFIGFHLAKELLEKGYSVYGYDTINNYYDIKLKKERNKILKKFKRYKFTKGNLENYNQLSKIVSKFKPKIIIHLAAQAGVRYSIDNPDVYLNSNILGTFNVLKISDKIKVKHLIIGSSSSVYGANKKIPFKEIDKTDSQISFYAATKKSTESLAHSYSSLWKLPVTMLRFFTVYGPFDRPDMALQKFAKAMISGESIKVFNYGQHKRDFTYIDDIIEGVIRVISNKPKSSKKWKSENPDPSYSSAPYKIYNIGRNKPEELMKYIESLEKNLGIKAKKDLLPLQPGDVPDTYADVNDLVSELNYKPKVSVEEGVRKFADWYKSYYNV